MVVLLLVCVCVCVYIFCVGIFAKYALPLGRIILLFLGLMVLLLQNIGFVLQCIVFVTNVLFLVVVFICVLCLMYVRRNVCVKTSYCDDCYYCVGALLCLFLLFSSRSLRPWRDSGSVANR